MALSIREQGNLPRAIPGRFHLRGGRPDARLFYSLHAISALLHNSVAFKNVICWAGAGWRWSEDVQIARQCRRSWMCSMSTAQMPSAGICIPPLHPGKNGAFPSIWSARWSAISLDALERLFFLRHLRQPGSLGAISHSGIDAENLSGAGAQADLRRSTAGCFPSCIAWSGM